MVDSTVLGEEEVHPVSARLSEGPPVFLSGCSGLTLDR